MSPCLQGVSCRPAAALESQRDCQLVVMPQIDRCPFSAKQSGHRPLQLLELDELLGNRRSLQPTQEIDYTAPDEQRSAGFGPFLTLRSTSDSSRPKTGRSTSWEL